MVPYTPPHVPADPPAARPRSSPNAPEPATSPGGDAGALTHAESTDQPDSKGSQSYPASVYSTWGRLYNAGAGVVLSFIGLVLIGSTLLVEFGLPHLVLTDVKFSATIASGVALVACGAFARVKASEHEDRVAQIRKAQINLIREAEGGSRAGMSEASRYAPR